MERDGARKITWVLLMNWHNESGSYPRNFK